MYQIVKKIIVKKIVKKESTEQFYMGEKQAEREVSTETETKRKDTNSKL